MGVWDSSSHILGEQEAESRQEEGPGYQTSRSTFSDSLPLAIFHPFKVPQPFQRGSPAGIKCSAQESVGETLHTQITSQTKQASSLLSEECVHSHCGLHRRQPFLPLGDLKRGLKLFAHFRGQPVSPE